jgi:hypothetical protein
MALSMDGYIRVALLSAWLVALAGCVVEPAPAVVAPAVIPPPAVVYPAPVWVPGYWAAGPAGHIWISGHWRIK